MHSKKRIVRKALKSLETRMLAAAGRASLRRKVATAAAVTRKAAKAGAIAAGLTAGSVVLKEIRKRRKI